MIIPASLLAVGSIIVGILFKETFIGHDVTKFWSDSILFLEIFSHGHPPIFLIFLTPLIVILAIPSLTIYLLKMKNY